MDTLTSARTTAPAITPTTVRPAAAPARTARASNPGDRLRAVLAVFTSLVAVAAATSIVMMVSTLPSEDFEVIGRLLGMLN